MTACILPNCGTQVTRGRMKSGWCRGQIDGGVINRYCSKACRDTAGAAHVDGGYHDIQTRVREARIAGRQERLRQAEMSRMAAPAVPADVQRIFVVEQVPFEVERLRDCPHVHRPRPLLEELNRLAGTSLTIMDVTPHRIEVALGRAFDRLIKEVTEQATQDAHHRPTISELLEEAGT